MKTGTPPRIDGRTIDYARLQPQYGDEHPVPFSFANDSITQRQVPCHITYTNERTHEIIRSGIHRSPIYSGTIKSRGPRYCPSIEDKIVRFADKERHQLFVEPEGWNTVEVYVNGFSTSLPEDVQFKALRTVAGFENVKFFRPGYAIEYDFFPPTQLNYSLETKLLENLFFAGQINGTTGYEEAAAQGLLAGMNAALDVLAREPWCPRRDEAYLGVLVDDLITRGVSEPYRMFTSRAEYRLSLREDNADLRLTEAGRRLGVVDDARWEAFSRKREAIALEKERLKSTWINPRQLAPGAAERVLGQPLEREHTLADLLRRPEVSYATLMQLPGAGPGEGDAQVAEQVEIQAKYQGYIDRQHEEIARASQHENLKLPSDVDYTRVRGLSVEAQQKLARQRPETLGQAARISGITPAAISVLLVHLKRGFAGARTETAGTREAGYGGGAG
jgi:tRNA uridine 5-carboxymethylaminomethyl modification enzyme